MLFESGLTFNQSNTVGIGAIGGQLGVGAGFTAGTSQRTLPARLAPPGQDSSRRGIIPIVIALIIALLFGLIGGVASGFGQTWYFWPIALAFGFFGVRSIMRTNAYNSGEWVERYKAWQNSVLCMAFGSVSSVE